MYGDIPKDEIERVDYILSQGNLHRCKIDVLEEIKRVHRIKWKKMSFTIFLLPKATPRPRAGKYGTFYVKGAKDNKKVFKLYSYKGYLR